MSTPKPKPLRLLASAFFEGRHLVSQERFGLSISTYSLLRIKLRERGRLVHRERIIFGQAAPCQTRFPCLPDLAEGISDASEAFLQDCRERNAPEKTERLSKIADG